MFALRCFKLKPTIATKYPKRHHSLYHRGVYFFLKKNLFLTNSITSGVFMAIGDLAQQEVEHRSNILPYRYDWSRLGRMLIVGTLIGPMHHYYYVYLDKLLPKPNFKTVMMKIGCDQAIVSPLTLLSFFYGMGLLERKSVGECTDEIKKKLLNAYMVDCMYWPPVQFLNFYFLPTHYRVVYINGATMIFNVFLSFIKHYDQHQSF